MVWPFLIRDINKKLPLSTTLHKPFNPQGQTKYRLHVSRRNRKFLCPKSGFSLVKTYISRPFILARVVELPTSISFNLSDPDWVDSPR